LRRAGKRLEQSVTPIIHDQDDRREYFDVESDAVRNRMAGSVVAFVGKDVVRGAPAAARIEAPSWSQTASLCPGERFGEQPAAAFCSGASWTGISC
jgi:hypothetical protein